MRKVAPMACSGPLRNTFGLSLQVRPQLPFADSSGLDAAVALTDTCMGKHFAELDVILRMRGHPDGGSG
jgi:hypothetical protein